MCVAMLTRGDGDLDRQREAKEVEGMGQVDGEAMQKAVPGTANAGAGGAGVGTGDAFVGAGGV